MKICLKGAEDKIHGDHLLGDERQMLRRRSNLRMEMEE